VPFYSAWDGQRKGLVLGLGGGVAVDRTTSTIGNTSESKDYAGVNVAARLGYATSNTFALYIFDNISIYDETYLDTIPRYALLPFGEKMVVEKELVHLGIGIGAGCYLREAAPSFFFEAGFGFCYFGAPVFQDTKTGFACDFAGGFEFDRHWSVKLEFLGATAGYGDYVIQGKKPSVFTSILTVNVLGY
jgi:hypothetical protein